MPKRQYIREYPTNEVQGEGSFVQMRDRSYGDSKKLAEAGATMTDLQKAQAVLDDMCARIVNWNWVDDEGNPLPLPKDNPNIFDELTEGEVNYLVKIVRGQVAAEGRKSG